MIKKGFSLAEMMVIMLLLSIALAASMPIITHRVSAYSDEDSDIPAGTIFMWAGSVVPTGWNLCDGTNGTPDLRSRFIYGAGGTDATMSKSMTSGWNSAITQHWPVGAIGSEELHSLLANINITFATKKIFVPRFIGLAYIMKLPSSNTSTTAAITAPTPITTNIPVPAPVCHTECQEVYGCYTTYTDPDCYNPCMANGQAPPPGPWPNDKNQYCMCICNRCRYGYYQECHQVCN